MVTRLELLGLVAHNHFCLLHLMDRQLGPVSLSHGFTYVFTYFRGYFLVYETGCFVRLLLQMQPFSRSLRLRTAP